MRGNLYAKGVCIFGLGAAGLAEHITSNRGSFPVCAVLVGLGLILMVFSYGKDR